MKLLRPVHALMLFLAIGLLISACAPLTSIQEPNHIVLLAPFEGLYRRSGYNALAAMQAVTDAPTHQDTISPIHWTPTALDTSRDPLRAAQKALAPANATAVVGPLTPADAAIVLSALQDRDVDWYAPFATTENGFTAPNDPAWLAWLLAGVASRAHEISPQYRILIAGWEPFSTITPIDRLSLDPGAQVVWLEASSADFGVRPGDLLLWLGDAAEGVRLVAEARTEHPDLAVWLPYWAAGDVFVEHASALDDWTWQGTEWGGWAPKDAAAATPAEVESALVAAATAAAMGAPQPEMEFVTAPLAPVP